MDDKTIGLSLKLKDAYNEQYSDKMTEWRELGGKYKARNILTVCQGYKFGRVLECGAGDGSILKYLNDSPEFSELYAVEISDSGIHQIRKRALSKLVEVKKFNGYTIAYPDGYFDMAYCSHVIEHVEHPRILLRELSRISALQVFEIPLDYSREVDGKVGQFLAYGHINIYTPSIFKFLLKSEGYEVLREHYSDTSREVIRYSWYRNMGIKRTFVSDAKLMLLPWLRILRRLVHRAGYNREFGFSAYTCLAKGSSELKIF